MSVLLPHQLLQQPQGPFGINWSNSITRGLRFCWFSGISNDLVKWRPPTYSGTRPTIEYGSYGVAQRFNGNGRIAFPRDTLLEPTTELSLLAITRPVSNASAFTNFLVSKIANTNTYAAYGLVFGPSAGYVLGIDAYDSTGVYVGTNFSPSLSTYSSPFVMTGSVATGVQRFFINGQQKAVSSTAYTTLAPSSSNNLFIGDYGTSSVPYNGAIGLVCMWDRALTPTEHYLLGVNPWQLFAPQQRRLFAIELVYYPASDVTTTGWSAVPPGPLYAAIDETTPNDSDYIISPNLAASPGPAVFDLNLSAPAGSYTVNVRAKYGLTAGQFRVSMLDSGGTSVGTSSWTAVTGAYTTYPISLTTTGTAVRVKIEVQ